MRKPFLFKRYSFVALSRCAHCCRPLFDYYANLSNLIAFLDIKTSRKRTGRSSQFIRPPGSVARVLRLPDSVGNKRVSRELPLGVLAQRDTMRTREEQNRKLHGYVSRRFSVRSRRYKKLAAQEELDESRTATAKTREENSRATAKEFDEFARNRYKGSRKAAKLNAAAAIEEDDGLDIAKEALAARCRRHAICEEMERYILNDAGISLRGYRELLVTRRLLFEMHLL